MNVKFGDVVREVKSNVDRANNPYEFYVAGDHMDTEDFRIRRRGRFATDDVGPAFIREFHAGQILYGSRRTYLKKVAVADFDGVCANTTFVLETKDEAVLSQRLLPFLMLSEDFTSWSVSHSKGSTNPYILYSDLADYEFDLPPLEEQKRLADKLWASYEVKESYRRLLASADELVKAQFIEMFGDPIANPKGWPRTTLGEHVDILAGFPFDSSKFAKSGIRICGGLIIFPSGIHWEDCKFWPNSNGLEQYLLKERDIVVALDRPWISEGFKIAQIDASCLPCLLIQRTARLRCIDINPSFTLFLLQCPAFSYSCSITGTTVPHISHKDIAKYQVFLPPLPLQQRFADFVEQVDKLKAELAESIKSIDAVLHSLINTPVA